MSAEGLAQALRGARGAVAISTPEATYELERIVIDVNEPAVLLIVGRGWRTCAKHNQTHAGDKCPLCMAELAAHIGLAGQ